MFEQCCPPERSVEVLEEEEGSGKNVVWCLKTFPVVQGKSSDQVLQSSLLIVGCSPVYHPVQENFSGLSLLHRFGVNLSRVRILVVLDNADRIVFLSLLGSVPQ